MKHMFHLVMMKFEDMAADVANRKSCHPMTGTFVIRMGTGNKRIHAFKLMDQPLLHQFFESPVNLQRRTETLIPQFVQNGIGT